MLDENLAVSGSELSDEHYFEEGVSIPDGEALHFLHSTGGDELRTQLTEQKPLKLGGI